MTPLTRLTHDLGAALRVAWFAGQYALTMRRSGPLTAPGEPAFRPSRPLPGRDRLMSAIGRLIARDREDCAAGFLPQPSAVWPDPRETIATMRRYFADLDAVDRRRLARDGRQIDQPGFRGRYPHYYLQNFHYQTDGYLSHDSAAVYDWQVETLFAGTAQMMRRQGVVPLARHLAGRDQRQARLVEIGCGTGAFLSEAARAFPRLDLVGVDLSRPYLDHARTRLMSSRHRHFIEASAEAVPIAAASADAVAAVYLLHELPPKARLEAAAEMARLKKPGGLVIIVDALQKGDEPEFDGLLELFPVGFHEPFFSSWMTQDAASLFARFGLKLLETRLAYLSKVMVFG